MLIHIPTIVVVLILGYAMLALQISVTRQGRESLPLRMWNLGNWALLGGFVLLIARLVMPLWLSAIGANILFIVGMALYSHAIYLFLHGTTPRLLWALLGGSVVTVIAGYPLNFGQRASVYALLDMLVLLPGIWHIVRHGWHQERALRTVAVSLILSCASMVWRAIETWSQTLSFADVSQPGVGPTLTFLVAFISMLGGGFGFILATLERSARHMEDLATHDGLTHCLNRNAAIALLGNALQRGQRTGEATSLVMLDLDHFKNVNDQYGHRAGDEVLRQFAQTARTHLRASDVLARMGGEEFALILPDTNTVGAVHVAESVRAAVEAMVVNNLKGGTLSVTVSAGVACALGGTTLTTPDQLYHRADTALYAAKEAGRNRIELAPDL